MVKYTIINLKNNYKQLKIGKKYASRQARTGKPVLTDNKEFATVFKNKSKAEAWLIQYSNLNK